MKKPFLLSLAAITFAIGYYTLQDQSTRTPAPQSTADPIKTEALPQRENESIPANRASEAGLQPHSDRANASLAEWLESQTIAVLFEEESFDNAIPTRTRILQTSLRRPYLRVETELPRDGSDSTPPRTTVSVANEFIVKLGAEATLDELNLLAASIDATAQPIGQERTFAKLVFQIDETLSRLPEIAKSIESAPSVVQYVEPDFLAQTLSTSPNDPYFPEQTNLHSPNDHDIDAPEAWDINHDAADIVIAIIDSGIRTTHEDLAPNLWRNPLETANGIDDDGNGIVDDLHGLNAILGNGEIDDENGHGSHVAGIAGARGNNEIGIAGVAWNVQLMALKAFDHTGYGFTSDSIECIEYATAQKVDVINNSWGVSARSQALYDALISASDQGILIATAAGNQNDDLDAQPVYPAAFSIPNQLVVIATSSSGEIAPYSNYSSQYSHIAAPGQVLSTFNTDDSAYTELPGTSMATPQVAGALALLKSQLPDLSPEQISARLLDSVDVSSGLSGYCLSGGQLNLNRALLGESNAPPNDSFAQANQIAPHGGRVSGSTTRAKTEEGEPLPDQPTQGHTVWHKWSPDHDGNAQLKLTPVGFASTLTVYEGETLSTLKAIASNSSSFTSNQVLLSLELKADKTYFFQIDSISTGSGPYSFEVALAAANDSFGNSTQLQGTSFNTLASNQAASSEDGETPIHPSANGASVWFEWTAPSDGNFYLRVTQATSQMFTSVFTGNSIAALTPVEASYEDRNFGNLLFPAVEGTTYRFAVDSLASSGSSFRIEGSYFDEPLIISQPSDQAVRLGSSARFSVTVFGPGNPTYQWLKDGAEIQGAQSETLILKEIEEVDLGKYQVRIQTASRTLYSREANLSLAGNFITFSKHPSSLSIVSGSTLQLSATVAVAPEGLSYQWTKNGTPIDGQNQQTLKIESATPADSGFYSLQVSDGKSIAISNPAYVLIDPSSLPTAFSWTQFNPNYFRGHIHRSGEYFIADESDYISFSADGYHWQFIPEAGSQVAYLNGYYYAAMDEGIYRSENMDQWTRVYSNNGTSSFNGIVAGNGILLCHTNSQVLSSTNGTSWTSRLSLSLNSIGHIHFGGGRFLINTGNDIKVSDNGLAWETVPTPESSAYKLSYASGKWWLFKGNSKQVYVSTDAITWETYEHPFDELMDVFSDLDSGQTYLIGITPDLESYSVSNIDLYRLGENGSEFVQTLHHGYDTSYPETVAIDGKVLVYLEGGPIPIESAPNTFNYQNIPNVWWKQATLSYANDKFIATYRKKLRSSSDGTNWILETSSKTEFGKIVYGNGLYVGTNHFGNELSSLKPHYRNFSEIAFANNRFVGVGTNNLYYSEDGESWTEAETQVSNTYYITAGGGVFVSHYDNEIFSSTNGSQWTKANLSEDIRFSRIAYGNQRFVAFYGAHSYTSINGINWTPKGTLSLPNGGGDVENLLFTQGKFIATYADDTYFESTDAATWQQLPFSSSNISFNQHIAYAASPDALLLCSKLGIGIIGAPPNSSLNTQITSPAKQVEVSLGTEVTIAFDAAGSATITRTEVYLSGQLFKTLSAEQRSFTYQPDQPGTHSLRIVSYDQDGNSSEDSMALTVSPLIHSSPPLKSFNTHDLIFYNGAFYAASDGGRIYISTDGKQWRKIQTQFSEALLP